MLLLLDNYDSFTYNLVQYFRELQQEIVVYQNDKLSLETAAALNPSHIIISPGPGRPENAGVTISMIQKFYDRIPILGVCLGHQAIGSAFGARIISATEIMHGKTSLIYHDQKSVFTDLKKPFTAMRYHSLVVDPATLSEDFEITAWTQSSQGELNAIMGVQHKRYPLVGVQFHPESIATESGHRLLKNFLELA